MRAAVVLLVALLALALAAAALAVISSCETALLSGEVRAVPALLLAIALLTLAASPASAAIWLAAHLHR